jgi:hypothetical protein
VKTSIPTRTNDVSIHTAILWHVGLLYILGSNMFLFLDSEWSFC